MYPQQFSGQQITTYYRPAQLDMTSILNAILPIMMLAMVFGMITPMFKSLSREIA
jgi:hypothetical protein